MIKKIKEVRSMKQILSMTKSRAVFVAAISRLLLEEFNTLRSVVSKASTRFRILSIISIPAPDRTNNNAESTIFFDTNTSVWDAIFSFLFVRRTRILKESFRLSDIPSRLNMAVVSVERLEIAAS